MQSVLVVDDNRISRELIRDVLEPLDLEIREAANGAAATHQLEQADIALVLVDIEMPVWDGYYVLAFIRNRPRLASTRVWAVTANAMDAARRAALKAGFDAYYTKPIDGQSFRREVEKALHAQI